MVHQPNDNAAGYFVDRHAAAAHARKPAFVEHAPNPGFSGWRVLTYAELATETDRMVGLYRRFGIRQEDRVAILMLDELAFPIVFWGSLKAGVVPVLLNTLLGTDVYDVILRDCRARTLFVSSALLPLVSPLLEAHPFIERVFVTGGEELAGSLSFASELAKSEPGETAAVRADEGAFWLYSSGSTGRPKGVRHVHGSLRVTADTYGARVLGIRSDDVVYSAAKLFFAYGLGNAMTFPMAVGATAVLFSGRPTPDAVADILETHQPTIFYGVPTLYAALLAHFDREGRRPNAPLRRCISAGEALPEEIGKRWASQFGVDILDGVGSTEMLHIFLSNAPEGVAYGTSGVAVPGYRLRLVDDSGAPVSPGQVGELFVDGDSAADGYWNQREKSRATFEGRWTRTGDKYIRSEDGRYIYCGRTDDMFKVSGIWVSPFEVEQALVAHERVLEAAVVARRDDEGLEKPMAFVVLKSGEGDEDLASDLREWVKTKIGMWKYPRWIEFVPDLPKTATGKIQRFRLRASAS